MRRSVSRLCTKQYRSISLPKRSNPDQFVRQHSYFRPPLQTQVQLNRKSTLKASYSSYVLFVVITCGGAIAFDYYTQSSTESEITSPPPDLGIHVDPRAPDYSKMPTPEGHLGNLTPDQEQKLKEFWAITLKTFGVQDQDGTRPQSNGVAHATAADTTPPVSEAESTKHKKHTKRLSLFSRKREEPDSSSGQAPSSPSRNSLDDDDKYGQTAQLKQILASQTPESLRMAFWYMVKSDHPDALLLRFLRARKWDVDRALAMLISTMHWRSQEMHVDDDVLTHGEGGALSDELTGSAAAKKEGQDLLAQFRMGKSFLHGTDKDGRPITYVRARLHKGGEQGEKALERYTVLTIETARLALTPPVETACIVFDMSHFTMANMDYTPVKFMIKIFEANYPESLGVVLVHKAPWIFQGIWKIIRGWLDPVVAGKVHFTNNVEDMEAFVPRSQIIKELGGAEDWEYKYIEPVDGENDLMKDTVTRDKLLEQRTSEVLTYQKMTFDWIAASQNSEKIRTERDDLARKLNQNYWQLDPYIRSRSLYDRVGYLGQGGKINFLPSHTLKTNGVGSHAQESHADDVD